MSLRKRIELEIEHLELLITKYQNDKFCVDSWNDEIETLKGLLDKDTSHLNYLMEKGA